jgi:peptidoglycan-associated lipoprotein
MNFKRLLSLFVVGLFVVGCSSSRKKSETEGAGDGGGAENAKSVESTTISFSPSGSDSGSIKGLQTIRFEFDKSVLSSEEMAKLKGNADWLKSNSKASMTIEGHCDQKGSNEYNLALGERRAASVKKLLVGMGISAKRLTTVSFGEEKLISQGESEDAMAKNRRANFVPAN